MTDNEVKKALECCGRESCLGCPYHGKCHQGNPMIKDTLDLITRQQAEIERLKEFIVETRRCDKEIKSDAVKEFADEFKSRCIKGGIYPAFVNRQLENVKKEMVGENNDL